MFHRPVSACLYTAIALSILNWSTTPLRADLVFLGFSAQNQDNPNGNSGAANVAGIVEVINNNLPPSLMISSSDLILTDKDEGSGGDNGFSMTGIGTHDGTFSFTGTGFIQILTLKSGNNPIEVYAVPTYAQSGNWENQYRNALSHASVWQVQGSVVPEPTSFAMFGIALIGLSRRRREHRQ